MSYVITPFVLLLNVWKSKPLCNPQRSWCDILEDRAVQGCSAAAHQSSGLKSCVWVLLAHCEKTFRKSTFTMKVVKVAKILQNVRALTTIRKLIGHISGSQTKECKGHLRPREGGKA